MNTQRRLRRVVGKDSSIAYEHPVREGREMVMCQPILREISTISRPFHVKVSLYTRHSYGEFSDQQP